MFFCLCLYLSLSLSIYSSVALHSGGAITRKRGHLGWVADYCRPPSLCCAPPTLHPLKQQERHRKDKKKEGGGRGGRERGRGSIQQHYHYYYYYYICVACDNDPKKSVPNSPPHCPTAAFAIHCVPPARARELIQSTSPPWFERVSAGPTPGGAQRNLVDNDRRAK